jgi:hypothetical protein
MPWKNRVFFLDGLSKIGTADRGAVRGLQMANSDSAPDAEKFTEMISARACRSWIRGLLKRLDVLLRQ